VNSDKGKRKTAQLKKKKIKGTKIKDFVVCTMVGEVLTNAFGIRIVNPAHILAGSGLLLFNFLSLNTYYFRTQQR
jgi:hypothetical protein